MITIKKVHFGRLYYLISNLILLALILGGTIALAALFGPEISETKSALLASLVISIHLLIQYVFIIFRYRNVGYSRAWPWALLCFVPVFNLWVFGSCLYKQTEYRQTNKLDKTGVIIAWIYWILILFPASRVLFTPFFP